MQARDNKVIWTGGGELPGGTPMEARIGKLEALADKIAERLGSLERDVAVIKSSYATRGDIADAKNSIVM